VSVPLSIRVRFEPAGVELTARAGERLLDLADEHPQLGLPLACRAANCGSCLVEVRSGGRQLEPPSARERDELSACGAGPGQRLGCQLSIMSTTQVDEPIVLGLPDG
jgi:ferredoxin